MLNANFDLGLNSYPIFSESYRQGLNTKIVNHYRFYEIGFETAERFKYELNQRMFEIMKYYNQLYETELLVIEPLLSFRETLTENNDRVTNVDFSKNENTESNLVNDTVNDKTSNTDTNNKTTVESIGTVDATNNNVSNSETDFTGDTTNNATNDENIVGNVKSNRSETNNKTEISSNKTIFEDTPQTNFSVTSGYATNITDISNNLDGENIKTGEDTTDTINDVKNISTSQTNNVSNSNTNSTSDTTIKSDTTDTSETVFTGIIDFVDNVITNSTTNNVIDNNVNSNEDTVDNMIRILNREGFTESQSALLLKFRETIINIDLMIINDLYDLFMLVY